ncbi:MAG: hypothetical protein JWO94_583 [Verrucomicrobiaceae bacterium]|nr:hypothetical protein [Verrucomicrobiaceae bacterium]
MKTNLDEQELTRWLDGEMDAAETASFEARMRNDAALRSEAETLRQLCADVKMHFPKKDLSHPDFFNSQIMERIGELERQDVKAQEKRAPWLGWLHRPWLAFAGAAAVLLLIGQVMFQQDPAPDTSTTVQNTYAPNGNIQPRAYHSNDANATVLELDGLEDIPADSKVVGYKVHHSDTNQQVATTTLYSDRGDVLQVLAMNDASQPRMVVP